MELAVTFISGWGLLIIPLLLLGGAIGAPFPEDLITLTTGYMVYRGFLPMAATLIVLFASIISADLAMYGLGRLLQAKVLPREKLALMASRFQRHGGRVVFFSRFIFGTRGPVFLAAGALRFPLSRFLLADLTAGILFIPGLFLVAFYNGEKVAKLAEYANTIGSVLLVVLVAVGGWALYRKSSRKCRHRSYHSSP